MSRSIFEEVSPEQAKKVEAKAPRPGEAQAARQRARRTISVWLVVLALMVVAQILVGGLTRLTDSGLSITEWRPVTGAMPPLSAAAWESEFDKYKTSSASTKPPR
ncbi:MAG: COX15/CtaA family protein, partial [Pseudomonadota bacterium]